MPFFTVVLATYNRGAHILPTIRSVLAQTFDDFELLVVGDACTDDTGEVLQPYVGERVQWFNLPRRGGSQSFPNNAGIERASGEYIAYIGHDDLWTPDHLERLAALFRKGVDLGVSGCICHPPPGIGQWLVMGLFNDERAKFEHFFPPSSFAHARRMTESIGGWRDGRTLQAPVDADLLLRAAHAGITFASTGKVTVHKFIASVRYLSYLRHSSDEQEALLRRMAEPGFEAEMAAIVEESKRAGTFMVVRHRYDSLGVGENMRANALRKGLARPELQPLAGSAVIPQTNEPRGYDWKPFAPGETRLRWSDLNPRPKILVPYTSDMPVLLRMQVAHQRREALEAVGLEIEGRPVRLRTAGLRRSGELWEGAVVAVVELSATDYSILTLVLPETALPGGETPGIAVGELRLDQLPGGAEPQEGLHEDGALAMRVARSREKALLDAFFAEQAELRAEAAAECARLDAERAAAAELAELRGRELQDVLATAAALEQRIADMKASVSWRIGAPLRELRRVGTRIRKELRRAERKLRRARKRLAGRN